MLITISGVLAGPALAEAQALVATLAWRNGAGTAGQVAKAVKHNTQADLSSRTGARLRDLIRAGVTAHPVLRAAAQPRRFSHLLVSKTETGGGYGLHIDNAFMGHADARMRTDLSFTLFLSEPNDYGGGALSIEHAGLTQAIKRPAGDLVLYPSTRLHAVEAVTRGARVACVGWIESRVRSAEDRETLFDLENLRASLAERHDPQSAEMLTLGKTIANLLRRFS